MISPRTLNNNFSSEKKNIITNNSLPEFKKKLNDINKSIKDIVWLSYKLGKSHKKEIKYNQKTISKSYINEVLKKIKENIKNVPEITSKIETNRIIEEVKEKNTKNIELYKKEMFEKNVKGFESFFINLKKEIKTLTENDLVLFQNFLKEVMKQKIQQKIKRYQSQKKIFHKRYFSVFKPFLVCDEFVEFILTGNFGNTFFLFFGEKEGTTILNGKIKENKQKILEMYSNNISQDPFLSKMSVPFLLEICNPNYFLFPVLTLNFLNYSFIITLLNIYIKVNCLKDSKNITVDASLKKLLSLKETTFYGTEKQIVNSMDNITTIERTSLFKHIKNFLKNNKENKVDEKTLTIIENYIYFVSNNVF